MIIPLVLVVLPKVLSALCPADHLRNRNTGATLFTERRPATTPVSTASAIASATTALTTATASAVPVAPATASTGLPGPPARVPAFTVLAPKAPALTAPAKVVPRSEKECLRAELTK